MFRVALALILPVIGLLALAPHAVAETEPAEAAAPTLRIGVLSYRGADVARRTWADTANHLRGALPGVDVRLVSMSLERLTAAAVAGEVDFVITNPGHSYQLVRRSGASRVASARSQIAADQTRALGSVIVTRADGPVTTLEEVQGGTLGIVSRNAFGGYQVALHRLHEALGPKARITPQVVGFPHQAVLTAVLDGTVDAGVVRACLIESLAATDHLDPDRFRVLGERDAPRFGCRTSTDLYPGWAFLKLPHVSPELATDVARALFAMPPPAGRDPWLGHDGWIAPVSYGAVEAVYRDLGLYPFGDDLPAVLRRWMHDNLLWVAVGAVLLGLFLLHVAHVELLVRRRTRQLEKAAQHTRHLESEMAHTERVSSMSMLAGSLAHDLNQPLAAISTYAHGLLLRHQRGTATPEVMESTLHRISEQANRASAFIRSMRAFLTKQPEHKENLDLREVVDEVVMLMKTHAAKQDCRLDWHRPTAPVIVHGDGIQLRQVAVALVQNALDATEGGCHIEISLDPLADTCMLTVADRGTGLDDAARARAFDPFFSTKGGLGLGLSTAASIVDHHDGVLTLDPRPGGGTLARVRLPLAHSDLAPSEINTDAAPGVTR